MSNIIAKYPLTNTTDGKLNASKLKKEIDNSGYVTDLGSVGKTSMVVGEDTIPAIRLSKGIIVNQTGLDGIIAAHEGCSLDEYKALTIDKINSKTGKLIEEGFEFPQNSGHFYSLSKNAQSNLHGLYANLTNPNCYPLYWHTKDDNFQLEITSQEVATSFYSVAFNTVHNHRQQGNSLKVLINNCNTKDEVDEVEDDRQ